MRLIESLKWGGRLLFYRSRLVQVLSGVLLSTFARNRRVGAVHLSSYAEEDAIGPLQRDEALLLLAITKTIAPATIVEFGFFRGHSAFNFLQVLPEDGMLFSFDITDAANKYAHRGLSGVKNFRFIQKSQTEFLPSDIDNRQIDLLFIDAAHELDLNQASWQAVLGSLSEEAIIAIHDTGLWSKSHFRPIHCDFANERPLDWLDDERFQHQKQERQFVNWILEEFPEYSAIHFHTLKLLRHGLTLVQKRRLLATE
jgi:predicted O-methyltransferase YrrM